MTLKEKFEEIELNLSECSYQFIGTEASNQCEKIADEFAIKVLQYYHNNLFYIQLKENEASIIFEHIKKQIGEI